MFVSYEERTPLARFRTPGLSAGVTPNRTAPRAQAQGQASRGRVSQRCCAGRGRRPECVARGEHRPPGSCAAASTLTSFRVPWVVSCSDVRPVLLLPSFVLSVCDAPRRGEAPPTAPRPTCGSPQAAIPPAGVHWQRIMCIKLTNELNFSIFVKSHGECRQ